LIKIIPMTEEEIARLPFPETARLLGGIMVMMDDIDPKVVKRIRRQWRITISKLKAVK
jgi:hypothetical protein